MKYQLKDFNRNIPDNELLEDIKRVATKLGTNSISSRDYNDNGGKYTAGTVAARFSSWNNALLNAGLQLVHQRDVSKEKLFGNLEQVWITIGRQPTFRDIKQPASKYSTHQYVTKFGNWRSALEAFVDYINLEDGVEAKESELSITPELNEQPTFKHKTKRFPSERLKVQVLMRDGNKCRLCGIIVTGDNINFDHIKPWSKDGETVLENLQVLCDTHNLAKGNLDYDPELGSR
ncbi:homing endonuclease associated repeat-containing protein [Mucilaginibacter sp.]|uniref:homing endonuclease associated repeat-containing protein n=1 Tax=Mucilaginibacter sp. TaxID=1882438 RepID=UPI003B00FD20